MPRSVISVFVFTIVSVCLFVQSATAASNYDGPAQLPIATVASSMADTPAPGSVLLVNNGDDLQGALNRAQCGDTVQLQAGAAFTGTFRFPALNCDDNHWIIVRTSSPDSVLPVEGKRLTPCYAGVASLPGRPQYPCNNPQNVLVKLVAGKVGAVIFQTGANHYRLTGLELTRPTSTKGAVSLISVDRGGTANHIVLDRSWVHGTAQDETDAGFKLSGINYAAVVDSYFSDFHCTAKTGSCMEAHAVSGGIGNYQDGPYKIENNFLESSGQAILFGGGAATMTPADIEIRRNHFFKPWQWLKGNVPFEGGDSGNPFIVRHHMEFKNAMRVLVEDNLMENVWGGFGESGYAILLTPKNQHTKTGAYVCPLCQVTDVTIRYVRIAHAGGGMAFTTGCDLGCQNSKDANNGGQAQAGGRFSIHDVVLDDISKSYVGSGTLFEVLNGWLKNPLNNITINHITGFPDADSHLLSIGDLISNPPMSGFVFTNNIVLTGKYPIWSSGGGQASCAYSGTPAQKLASCFATYTFIDNALIAAPSHYPPSSWPTGNLFASDLNDVGFIQCDNGNGGNYELQPESPYKNKGTDGKDLGADMVGLNEALMGVE